MNITLRHHGRGPKTPHEPETTLESLYQQIAAQSANTSYKADLRPVDAI